MSSVTTCPHCNAEISVPANFIDRLRCPLCQGEFTMRPVMVTPNRRDAGALQASATPVAAMTASVEAAAQVRAGSSSRSSERHQGSPARSSSPGLLGNLIGVIGGGFLGLAAGYYLLNFFGGPKFDLLHVPLPSIAHTQPGWIPPSTELRLPATLDTDIAEAPDPLPEFEAPTVMPQQGSVVPATAIVEIPPAPSGDLASPVDPPARPAETPASYSPDQLGEALAVANAAIGCERCSSTGFVKREVVTGARVIQGKRIEQKAVKRFPCEDCQGQPSGRVTQANYHKLCRLAEVVTHLKVDAADDSVWQRKLAVESVFLKAAGDREKTHSIGRLAGHWLENQRRDADGVLLAGTVQGSRKEGPYFLTEIVLFGLPTVVTVASNGPAGLQAEDRVLIAGSIVEEPSKHLAEYEGNLPRLVWGGMPLKLPADPR